MADPNYTFQLIASPIGGTAGLSLGDIVVYDSSSLSYLLATTANRGTKRASGICRGAAAVNGAVVIQNTGDIPPSVSGLGTAATGQPVRVSSAGRLERVTTWVAADDVCGWAETDGTVHLFFGGAGAGAVITGAPDGSNIVVANPSTWGPSGSPIKSKLEQTVITSAAGTAVAVGTIDIPDNTSCDLTVTILARRSDNSTYRADLFATYKRTSAGAPTLVGSAATEQNKRNDAGAAYTGALAISGNNIAVNLTPTAGHTLNAAVVWQRQDRT